jgi:HPt (histidine-containing phosphotransfer) domain-containing protein
MTEPNAQARAAEEVQRLRLDAMLNAEIIRTLRAAHDSSAKRGREFVELEAQICASIHERITALSNANEGALESESLGTLLAVTGDLADYTKSRSGELVLEREQLNLRHWLFKLESTLAVPGRSRVAAVRIIVGMDVPDRVVVDPARLLKVLTHLIDVGANPPNSGANALVLEVSSTDAVIASAATNPESRSIIFSLLASGQMRQAADLNLNGDGAAPSITYRHCLSPEGRLRAALVEQLWKLMGITITPVRSSAPPAVMSITVPMQSSPDQGHTGSFRLANTDTAIVRLRSRQPASPALRPTAFVAPPEDSDDAVDLLYLDRQLGSLATVILERTTPAFLDQAAARMTDLYVALELKDVDRICRLAHVWKASAMTVGARRFAAMLDTIEKQSAAGQLPGEGQFVQLRDALDRLVRVLENRSSESEAQHESV